MENIYQTIFENSDDPKLQVEKIIKFAGTYSFTDEAIILLNKIVIEKGMEISSLAVILTKNADRKTVKESDIKLAELYCQYAKEIVKNRKT